LPRERGRGQREREERAYLHGDRGRVRDSFQGGGRFREKGDEILGVPKGKHFRKFLGTFLGGSVGSVTKGAQPKNKRV